MPAARIGARRYVPALAAAASIALGLAIAYGGPMVAVLLAVLLVLPLAIAPHRARVAVVAVLLVALANGIPFLNLSVFNLSGSFNFQDPIVIFLFAIGALELVSSPATSKGVLPRWVLVLLGLFTAAWVIGVVAGTIQGTPALKAILFGRDLLTVWLLAVVALVVHDRRDVGTVLGVLVAASVVYALAHAMQVGLGIDTSLITHPRFATESLGFARLYAPIIPLTVMSFFVALAWSLWGTASRMRTLAVAATLILGVEQLLQLTRANYIALIVALVAGTIAAFTSRTVRWGVGRAGNTLIGITAALAAAYLASLTSFANSSIWLSVQNRIASTASDISSNAGNVGYRLVVYSQMFAVLGTNWLFGLGFQHPEYHWFPTLPDGSLRNTDVGALSVLMPIGLAGLVPLLLLAVGGIVGSLRALSDADPIVKVVAWSCLCTLIVAIVSVPTLGYLSTLPGLLATAVSIGLLCRVRWSGFAPETAPEADPA